MLVGTWVHGLFVVGQTPWARRRSNLPAMQGKRPAVFCTFALNPARAWTSSPRGRGHGRRRVGGLALTARSSRAHTEVFVTRLVDAERGRRRASPGASRRSPPRPVERPTASACPQSRPQVDRQRACGPRRSGTRHGGGQSVDADLAAVAVDELARCRAPARPRTTVPVGRVGPIHAPPAVGSSPAWSSDEGALAARGVEAGEDERPVLGDRSARASTLPTRNVVGASARSTPRRRARCSGDAPRRQQDQADHGDAADHRHDGPGERRAEPAGEPAPCTRRDRRRRHGAHSGRRLLRLHGHP